MVKIRIIQIVVGAAFYFLCGWFVFDFILGDYTEKNTTQLTSFKKTGNEFSYAFLVISCIAYAVLMTFILSFSRQDSIRKGFFIGSVVGMLVAFMTDSYWYASSKFYANFTVVILDIIAAGICVGGLGAIVNLIYRIFKD